MLGLMPVCCGYCPVTSKKGVKILTSESHKVIPDDLPHDIGIHRAMSMGNILSSHARNWKMSSKNISKSTSSFLEPVNVTAFGERVFADIIKDIEIRSSWITSVGPK
jgi:hypothetical protein